MQNDKYAAHVYVNREVLSDKNIIRFSARVVFPDGAEIVKYLDAPNDREYNPNDIVNLYTHLHLNPWLSQCIKLPHISFQRQNGPVH